jgi:RNA polymerase sigma factor for flagellar operon FliA
MFTMRAPHAFHRSPDAERDDTQDTDLMGSLADQDQETPIEAIDRREMMEKIESSLQPVEWDVLRMHYLEGMSGKEVARKLHLSASRICQIHGRVLSRLKSRLSNQE